jgi:hypothetical protein
MVTDNDDDVYLDKLQTRGIKKCILYIDQPIRLSKEKKTHSNN